MFLYGNFGCGKSNKDYECDILNYLLSIYFSLFFLWIFIYSLHFRPSGIFSWYHDKWSTLGHDHALFGGGHGFETNTALKISAAQR